MEVEIGVSVPTFTVTSTSGIFGGMGTMIGPVVGALLVYCTTELLRDFGGYRLMEASDSCEIQVIVHDFLLDFL